MLILSGISLACLGLYSRRFIGRVPAAAPYALLMFMAFAWTVFYAFELMAGTLQLKIIFHNLRYLILPFLAVIELWLVIAFVERTEWLRKDWAAVALVIPVAALVLGITGPLHTLFRYNFSLDSSGPVTVLGYTEGPFYTIFTLYSLVLLTLAIAILVIESRKRGTLWRAPTVLLIIALAFPTVTNYLFALGLTPVPGVNMTAPLLWISAVLYTVALFRFQFLDIIPIARSRVIEEMGMPMIVVDAGGTVVDLNPAAGSLLGGPSQPLVGKQVRDLAPDWPEFIAFCETGHRSHEEFTRIEGQGTRTYSGTIDILYSTSWSPEGKLILLADITEFKRVDSELQRRSATLSILNNIITAANKAEDLPHLLESILGDSLSLLDFDTGGIYLVNRATRTADIVLSKNIPPEFLAEIHTVHIDEKPYDRLFIHSEPVITENYAQIAPGTAKKSGIQSIASIPLLSKGEVIGALNVGSTRRYVISEEERQTLISIGRELGSTIAKMESEEEAKQARKNVETLFNSIDEMVFVLDMKGRILSVNNAVLECLSYAPWDLTGTDVLLLHVPEQRDEALRNVQGMIAGTIDSCPVPILTRDGTRIDVETKVTRGRWNNQDVLIGVSRNITTRKRAEESLRDSEAFNRGLVENLPDYIMVYAPDGKILYVNPATERSLGFNAEELVGKPALSYIAEEHRDYVTSRMVLRNEGGEVSLYETEIVARDGHRRSVTVKGTAIQYHNSPAFLILLSDITERKRAEEGLRKSENLLRSMIESPQSIIIFSLDREYRYLAFNTRHQETMKAIWGVDICPGMNMPDTIRYESDRKKARQNFDRALAGEHFMRTEEYGDDTLGRKTWEDTYSPIYDENHQVIGLTVYVIDVTGRKKAEEKLRKLSDRLSLATRAGGVGIWEYDVVNNTLSWDDQMFTLYGTTREQFGGAIEAWRVGVHPEDRERGDTEIRMALSGEREFNTEFRVLRPDGSIRNIRALAIVQRDAGGKPVRMIGTNWDITVEKNTEEALRQANRKLNLLSTITRHDINNQLTVVIGFLGILEDIEPGPLQAEYIQKITSAAERISAIIQFTREYENIGVRDPAWQDCRTLVDTAAKQAPLGRVRVENDLPAGMEVFADQLIVKVCYNLMDNATRYGGRITTIRFFAETRDGQEVIVCEDDGVGIPIDEKEKIFERGFGKNTGLGLFLTREILSITGITIKETGEAGKGARFEMAVPKGMWRSQERGKE